MSPEQATGKTKEIKEPSDVYSLGSVFFTLLTGKPPLEKETGGATLVAIATEDAPPLPSKFGPALVGAVKKALERDKEKRFENAGTFKAELESLLPPNCVKPDAVAKYISESLKQQEDPHKTTFDGGSFDSEAIEREVRTRSKTLAIPPWTIYASTGTLAVAIVVGAGLWALHVQRQLAEPIPPPPPIKIEAPPPPKEQAVIVVAKPRPPEVDERPALEKRRASIEIELEKNSRELKSLQALGENPERQAELDKLCRGLKGQLDSISSKTSAL